MSPQKKPNFSFGVQIQLESRSWVVFKGLSLVEASQRRWQCRKVPKAEACLVKMARKTQQGRLLAVSCHKHKTLPTWMAQRIVFVSWNLEELKIQPQAMLTGEGLPQSPLQSWSCFCQALDMRLKSWCCSGWRQISTFLLPQTLTPALITVPE